MKTRGNIMGKLTQSLLIHLLFTLTIYQINAITLVFYSMVRYADYQIYIFIKIYETLEITENCGKNKGIYLQNYSYLSCSFP